MKVKILLGNRLVKTKSGNIKKFASKESARKYLFARGYSEKDIPEKVKLVAEF